MTDDMTSTDADFHLYTRTAEQYDRVRFSGAAGRWGHQRQTDILRALAEDWRGKRVLEIGCGTGRITQALASWGARVTATDISEEMLRVAGGRFERPSPLPTPEFRVMSVFNIDIDLHRYDYVIMVNVFGRLSNGEGAIREVASRISERCQFVFTFPCLTSVLFPAGLIVNVRGKSLVRNVTSRWYRPETVLDYCRSAYLEVIEFRGCHYVPVPRFFFAALPFFWLCDRLLATRLPHRCPSVFAVCRRRRLRTTHTCAYGDVARRTVSDRSQTVLGSDQSCMEV